MASLTTKSARFTSADLICAGDQSGCSCRSTAAPPAMCGVAIDVPEKNAHPEPSPGHPAGLPTHVIELRTLTATEATSGLRAKSTTVGPWLLLPYAISLLVGVMNSWNVARADAVVSPDTRGAPPVVFADHHCWYVIVKTGCPGHCNGISSDVVDDDEQQWHLPLWRSRPSG